MTKVSGQYISFHRLIGSLKPLSSTRGGGAEGRTLAACSGPHLMSGHTAVLTRLGSGAPDAAGQLFFLRSKGVIKVPRPSVTLNRKPRKRHFGQDFCSRSNDVGLQWCRQPAARFGSRFRVDDGDTAGLVPVRHYLADVIPPGVMTHHPTHRRRTPPPFSGRRSGPSDKRQGRVPAAETRAGTGPIWRHKPGRGP